MTLRPRKRNVEKKKTVWYCDYTQEPEDIIAIQAETPNEKNIEHTSEDLKDVELFTNEGNISRLARPSTNAVSSSASELPTTAKHSLSTSVLPTSINHCKHSATKSHKSPKHSKSPARTRHCLTYPSQQSLTTSTLPRNCKMSTWLLLPDKDSEGELRPEMFGLYLEPGVIRCSFEDYPLAVLREKEDDGTEHNLVSQQSSFRPF